MTSTAVETNGKGIVGLLTSAEARKLIEPFLPKGVDIERVAASAKMALANTPALAKCTPQSLVMAVARIQSWGLEVGQTGHLVPFGDTCTPIADYRGLCELAVASGAIRHIEAREVREGDRFEYSYGLNANLVHTPSGKQGAITHVYIILHLPFNKVVFDVMTIEEVEAIRKQYSKQWKTGVMPYWYMRKTIIRRAMKTIPKNERLAKLFAVMQEDAQQEHEGVARIAEPDDFRQLNAGRVEPDDAEEFPPDLGLGARE